MDAAVWPSEVTNPRRQGAGSEFPLLWLAGWPADVLAGCLLLFFGPPACSRLPFTLASWLAPSAVLAWLARSRSGWLAPASSQSPCVLPSPSLSSVSPARPPFVYVYLSFSPIPFKISRLGLAGIEPATQDNHRAS